MSHLLLAHCSLWPVRFKPSSSSSSSSSSTAIAIRGKDGVVFAVEKVVTSKLHERSSNHRLFTIDRHVGIVSVCVCWIDGFDDVPDRGMDHGSLW